MSTPDQVRKQIDDVVKKRAEAERRLADARGRQAKKDSEVASYRSKAVKTSSPSLAKSYLRQADSAQNASISEGTKAAEQSKKIADCGKKEADLSKALSAALQKERGDQQRARKRQDAQDDLARRRLGEAEKRARDRERAADRARTDALVLASEGRLSSEIAKGRPAKVERLRILYVTAASEGDLRVDKEIRRVKKGVKTATLRELVEIEHLSAATPSDLLDGMSGFKPHVVHFSGHANKDVLVFDTEDDNDNPGQHVSADLFARALGAVDEPPLLVVLNACDSEGHLERLLKVVPMAIGMSDEIGDADAMSFATRFYTAIADGQSVGSAFGAARVQMEFDGMPDADLPVISVRPDVDWADVPLVIPPPV